MCRLRNIAMRGYQESVTTGQTDGQTDVGQSDPYVPLCFAGDTKMVLTLPSDRNHLYIEANQCSSFELYKVQCSPLLWSSTCIQVAQVLGDRPTNAHGQSNKPSFFKWCRKKQRKTIIPYCKTNSKINRFVNIRSWQANTNLNQ